MPCEPFHRQFSPAFPDGSATLHLHPPCFLLCCPSCSPVCRVYKIPQSFSNNDRKGTKQSTWLPITTVTTQEDSTSWPLFNRGLKTFLETRKACLCCFVDNMNNRTTSISIFIQTHKQGLNCHIFSKTKLDIIFSVSFWWFSCCFWNFLEKFLDFQKLRKAFWKLNINCDNVKKFLKIFQTLLMSSWRFLKTFPKTWPF